MSNHEGTTGGLNADVVVSGSAAGIALVSDEPLSFWGGYDATTGEIVDRRHPLSGQNASGKILVIPFTRGSSTTAQVLLEAIREGNAPAAIICRSRDSFLSLAAIVADEMWHRTIPIVALAEEDFARIQTGQRIVIEDSGAVTIVESSPS